MRIEIKFRLLSILLVLIFLLSGCQYISPSPLAIHVLDVGQGDSILIATPNNKTILIDGGEGDYGETVVNYIKDLKIKKIDWLIATHPHADHIGGLVDVINNFEIGEFFMPAVAHNSQAFENLLLAIDAAGMKVTTGKVGVGVNISKDLFLEFIGPVKDYGDQLNNWSIVNRLQYKEKSFIFMGDAEHPAEMDLLRVYPKDYLKSHFIKIGHHGSNSSTGKEFLAAIDAEVAVISVGKNNLYGHPHKDTLHRISENNINLYRTDYQGTMVFYSDGVKIWSPIAPIN